MNSVSLKQLMKTQTALAKTVEILTEDLIKAETPKAHLAIASALSVIARAQDTCIARARLMRGKPWLGTLKPKEKRERKRNGVTMIETEKESLFPEPETEPMTMAPFSQGRFYVAGGIKDSDQIPGKESAGGIKDPASSPDQVFPSGPVPESPDKKIPDPENVPRGTSETAETSGVARVG